MKKLFLCIPALAILSAACQKVNLTPAQEDVNEPAPAAVEMITETVSGTRGAATKATIADADASFAWTVGDKVAVHVDGATPQYVVTSVGADAAAASAKFTVEYETGYARNAFAVYPSTIVAAEAANYGQSGHTLDLTLPGSYKLAEVSGETSPGPMISTNNAGENWEFHQLCGLLRLTVNDIPSTAKRLEIDFNGKKVCGDFSIASPEPGNSVIATADDTANDCITITKDGTDVALGATNLVVNIPLPVGTYTTITITAYDALTDGNVVLTIDRPFAYTASNEYGTKRTASFPSSKKAFRGYEVSTGILERTAGTPATYSLTSGAMILTADPDGKNEHYSLPAGCNPFEPAVYYGNNASRGKYYNSWTTLQDELGADGDNINATSDKLPAGWRFPTFGGAKGKSNTTDWGRVLYGVPEAPITVNGTTVGESAYAMVSVTLGSENSYSVAAGTYNGVFLLRDGTSIPTGYLTKVGGNSRFTDNPLTEMQFNDLVKLGCLFISASGYYNSGWKYPEEGYYWSSTFASSGTYVTSQTMEFYTTQSPMPTTQRVARELVVMLVKPVSN